MYHILLSFLKKFQYFNKWTKWF